MGRRSTEYFCDSCHSEYMIIYDEDDLLDNPSYCPFCCAAVDDDDDDDFEDYGS